MCGQRRLPPLPCTAIPQPHTPLLPGRRRACSAFCNYRLDLACVVPVVVAASPLPTSLRVMQHLHAHAQHTCTCTCTCLYMCTCVHVHVCTCVHVYMCTCACTCTCDMCWPRPRFPLSSSQFLTELLQLGQVFGDADISRLSGLVRRCSERSSIGHAPMRARNEHATVDAAGL